MLCARCFLESHTPGIQTLTNLSAQFKYLIVGMASNASKWEHNSVKPRLPADLYYRPVAHRLSAYIILRKITSLYGKFTGTDTDVCISSSRGLTFFHSLRSQVGQLTFYKVNTRGGRVWNGAEPIEMAAKCRIDCHSIIRSRDMLHGVIWYLKVDLPLPTPEERRRHFKNARKYQRS